MGINKLLAVVVFAVVTITSIVTYAQQAATYSFTCTHTPEYPNNFEWKLVANPRAKTMTIFLVGDTTYSPHADRAIITPKAITWGESFMNRRYILDRSTGVLTVTAEGNDSHKRFTDAVFDCVEQH